MLIDAHLDLAMNALYLKRDITGSAHDTRRREGPHPRCGTSTVGLADLIRGEFGICFATVSVLERRAWMPPNALNFKDLDEAHQQGQEQITIYEELEQRQRIRLIHDREGLERHLVEWNTNPDERRIGVVLLMEGAYPIRTPAETADWFKRGVRIIGLSWAGSQYAGGTYGPGRLTQVGKELLAEMERIGVILDVSHLNDASFFDVLDNFGGHVLGSHVNCRALVPGERQLTDQMIRELIARDAVLGTACDAWMLVPKWKKKVSSPSICPMERIADHIDHVCQLAGNARHAAIGSDLDGGYGTEQSPGDLDTIADLARIGEILSQRGYVDQDVAAITHENWLRKLRSAWHDKSS